MATAVQTMAVQIKGKRIKLLEYYDKKGPDGTIDVDATGRDAMKAHNDELNVLMPKYEKLREDELAEAEARKGLDDLNRILLPEGFHGGGGQGQGQGRIQGSDGAYLDRRGELKGLGTMFGETASYKS